MMDKITVHIQELKTPAQVASYYLNLRKKLDAASHQNTEIEIAAWGS